MSESLINLLILRYNVIWIEFLNKTNFGSNLEIKLKQFPKIFKEFALRKDYCTESLKPLESSITFIIIMIKVFYSIINCSRIYAFAILAILAILALELPQPD